MRYGAFISYSHADERWAQWLHGALERYRVPKRLIGHESAFGPLARKLPPIFRDRDELASSADLAGAVTQALRGSSSLIVICSPESVRSRWVNEEIRSFAALGRSDRIFCLIVAGEPHAADPERECFPPALFAAGHHEPLAADVRPGQDGKRAARTKLLAGLLGVGYDELRQREAVRRQRQLAAVAIASCIGLLLTSTLAIFAFISRADAIRQRDIAERKTITAERTVSFVKSLFEVSDPSEARGQTITAREILDNGARNIRTGLRNEPAVKAELGTTLGEVYSSLGLYKEGDRLIREMMALHHDDRATRARQLLALADSQTRLGDYDPAIASYRKALAMARNPDQPREDLVPRILVGLGEALSAAEHYDEAAARIEEGLKMDLVRFGPNHPDVARDLEAHGLNAFYAGALARAQGFYERAVAIRLKTQGATHPRVPEDQATLGSIAYLRGNSALAEADFRKATQSYQTILGPNHPEVANTTNNLARIILERRAYREALPLLERAVAIDLRERGPNHDDVIFPLSNLAIVKAQLGDRAGAEPLFRQALHAARLRNHRNLAPILVDLANLRCQAGAFDEALRLLDEARPIMAKTYAAAPWRVAWVDNTRGECLLLAGQREKARQLIEESTPVILAKWRPETHFGAIARARRQRLGEAA